MPVTEIVLFCLGAFVGSLISVVVLPSTEELRRLRDELSALKKEHSSYREGVTQHFHKTSELVGEMTQSYKRVYDHLASGAQTLCEVPSGEETLPFSAAPLIEMAAEPAQSAAAPADAETPTASVSEAVDADVETAAYEATTSAPAAAPEAAVETVADVDADAEAASDAVAAPADAEAGADSAADPAEAAAEAAEPESEARRPATAEGRTPEHGAVA